MSGAPQGYRSTQIALHWLVAAGVALLFFTGDATTEAFRAGGGLASLWVGGHALVGTLILLAMLWRLQLRLSVGVPAPPQAEWAPLRILAHLVHVGLYLDLILAALLGLGAYFAPAWLGAAHEFAARIPLVLLFALHFAGALWHHFAVGDDVMRRMVRATGK